MNFSAYEQHFQSILQDPNPAAPYHKPDYFEYAKLNWSRMNRWLKVASLSDDLKASVDKFETVQHWTVITEAWCGDAAHIIPFFQLIALWNPLIEIDYRLRDTEPFMINDYLTNGGKAIPKLIIRDDAGKDLAVWGPRPAECQALYGKLKAEHADAETSKTEIQKWYNQDKGKQIQEELTNLLNNLQGAIKDKT